MSGTASVPGWWVEFQAAVIRQLPRPDQIDQVTAEGWSSNQRSLKRVLAESLLPSAEPAEKFALLVDLGIITVPEGYDHTMALAHFAEKNRNGLYYYNEAITDENFPNPTRVLKPGDKLRVCAWKQVVPGTTTSEERLAFLATQKAIHVGAQGASLVWDQKRDQLPKGKWYNSLDEKDRLWADADGDHWVPSVDADLDGGFCFLLSYFKSAWDDGHAFLCFYDA